MKEKELLKRMQKHLFRESVRQQVIMQHDSANCEGEAGDVDSSVSTGRSSFRSSKGTSSRTGGREDSQGSNTQTDDEEEADTSSDWTLVLSPSKKQDKSMTAKPRTQNNRGQWWPKKNNNNSEKSKAHVFPPIKSNERIWSAHRHHVLGLNNQVWELKQQLRGASMENKLLKQIQGRHTVALQHFQDAQSALPQLLAKHNSEVQALQTLHRKSCIQHNSVSRHLRATEKELLKTKDSLHRLQMFSDACSLEERVELSHRLNLVTIDIDRKSKRIQELERNLELNQTTFSRHLATETRKTSEAREMSNYLQAQISQLTKKIKERERELEICNIYTHRFSKGWNRKGARETKCVQTEQIPCVPIEAPCQLELKNANRLPCLESELKRQERLRWEPFIDSNDAADKLLEDRGPTDAEDFAGARETKCVQTEQIPCVPIEAPCQLELKNSNRLPCLESELKRQERLRWESFIDSNDAADKLLDDRGPTDAEDFAENEELEGDADEEGLQLQEEENDHSHQVSETLHLGANKGLKSHSRTKRLYRFKETIQNLHSGKPAYSTRTHSLRMSPPKYIDSQAREENLVSEVHDPLIVTLLAKKSKNNDTTGPKPEDGVFQNKKSNLMKELFGQSSITDKMTKQTGISGDQITGLDSMSSYHSGNSNPILSEGDKDHFCSI
ncbi:hypothetical protein UPYG_G00201360 [Umbra pygmaea]|uniref:Lebercilin-like protein n=1 Tax=Umbra pygmaea TaxID=75934 RepID=A0ABD0WIA8_UMBPY